jgi:hypothetical protein
MSATARSPSTSRARRGVLTCRYRWVNLPVPLG